MLAKNGHRTQLLVLFVLVTALVASVTPGSASAADLTLTVTPSTDIAWDGEVVDIAIVGEAVGAGGAYGVCSADVFSPDRIFDLNTACTILSLVFTDPPTSLQVEISSSAHSTCRTTGCAIVYAGFDDTSLPATDFVVHPITFTDPPIDELTMTVSPSTGIAWDGQVVDIALDGPFQSASGAYGVCPEGVSAPFQTIDLLSECTLLTYSSPPLRSLQPTLSLASHGSCPTGCAVVFAGFDNFFAPPTDFVVIPIDFTDVPPPPGVTMSVTPTTGLVHDQLVSISVDGRHPATASADIRLCRADADLAAASSHLCVGLWARFNDAAPVEIDARLPRADRGDNFDCAVSDCLIAYRGSGSVPLPFEETFVVPVEFVPDAPLFTASPTTALVVGDPISVTWNAFRDGELPTHGQIDGPYNFVGICLGDAPFDQSWAFDGWECEGVDLGSDAFSGSTIVEAKRFIQTGREGLVDCVTYEYGCKVSYSLGYVDNSEFPEEIALHNASVPITLRKDISINGGASTAVAGASVPIVTHGLTTGPVAFVMMCAIGNAGGFDLRCAPQIGDFEVDFDGDFDGAITMPESITVGASTFDCTIGRGCIVAFAVIDFTLAPLFGHGKWVRAIPPSN